jgi:hypothetical protein
MTEQLRIWAGLQGFVSAAALLALILFFALAQPYGDARRQWFWLGPVNDWLLVLGTAPWIVAMVLLAARTRVPGWVWALTVVTSLGVVAMAAVTVLMLGGRATLATQTAVTLPAALLGFVWIAVVGALAVGAVAVPRGIGVSAVVIAIVFTAGGVLAAAGWSLPEASALRMPMLYAGLVPALSAWAAFPAWWIAVAATAR